MNKYICMIIRIGVIMMAWTSLIVNHHPWDYTTSQEAHDNALITWTFFRSHGFTEEATAGILGNLSIESYMNPGQIGLDYPITKYSPKGLMMFTTTGAIDQLYDYAANMGETWDSGNAQINLILDNPNNSVFFPRNGYNYTWEEYKSIANIEEATKAFCWEAEAPGVPHMESRIAASNFWYAKFSGGGGSEKLPLWMMGRELIRRMIIYS